MQIFVGTPVYKEEHPAHLLTREACLRHFGDRVVFHVQRSDSCLARARAALFAEYLKDTRPWTHYLQCDDDQSWMPEHLEHAVALSARWPLLGIPCAYKFDPPHAYAGYSTIRGLPGEPPRPDAELTVPCGYLGGGWILWSREVLEAMMAKHPALYFRTNTPAAEREPTYDFWSTGVHDEELLSEDYRACRLATEAGYPPRAWLGACSPHWTNPPEDRDDPSTWRAYVPTGYTAPQIARRPAMAA